MSGVSRSRKKSSVSPTRRHKNHGALGINRLLTEQKCETVSNVSGGEAVDENIREWKAKIE